MPDEFGTGSLSQKVDRVSGSSQNFTYRADQKLVSYSRDGMQAEYFYDALGRRVAKRVTKGAEPAFTQSYVYLGEEDKILLGKSGDGEVTLYLDGQGIDEHLGEVSSRGVKAYATDHLGSVLNGEAAGAARAFGAWGENLSSSASTITAASSPVAYGFTGRQLDSESQTYYYRARTYLPDTGRFAQPDPIGFDGKDTNLYRYVKNDPLKYIDPKGLLPMDSPGWDRFNEAVQSDKSLGAICAAVACTTANAVGGGACLYAAPGKTKLACFAGMEALGVVCGGFWSQVPGAKDAMDQFVNDYLK
ncbi:MAG: hypothetical protein A2X94_03185 [Bdellovibrionales bacterium GWB1_55_8]|nr:MAG: hypothetical protein A2X94_03185 [Bdellovibrionales bacterium GWB1_55_8]